MQKALASISSHWDNKAKVLELQGKSSIWLELGRPKEESIFCKGGMDRVGFQSKDIEYLSGAVC